MTFLKAQISLESLLVFTVMLSFLFILMPAIQKGYSIVLYVIDLRNAFNFKENAEFAVKELVEFKTKESVVLEAKPINEWLLKANKNRFSLKIKNEKLNEEKELFFEANSIEFQEIEIVIRKQENIEFFLQQEKIVIQEKPLTE